MSGLTNDRALSRLVHEYPVVGGVLSILMGVVCVGLAVMAIVDGSLFDDDGKLAWKSRAAKMLFVKVALAAIFIGFGVLRILS